MLLSKTAKVRVDKRNYEYYTNKGYKINLHIDKDKHVRVPKGTYIIVKVEDLPENSCAHVNIKCDYCGKEYIKKYVDHLTGHNIVDKDCCSDCTRLKTTESNMIKYGTNSLKEISKIEGFKIGRDLKFTKDELINYFANRGLIVQTNLLDEKNIKVKDQIPYICSIHFDKGIQYITPDALSSRDNCCEYGFAEQMSVMQSQSTIEDVRELCEQKEYILLTNEIHNIDDKVEFICSKHQDYGIQNTSLWGLRKANDSCRMCKQHSGEDHWNWKGGVSNLHEHLREYIIPWKQDSYIHGNYTCSISNIKGGQLIIHHLYSFNKIVEETMKILNLPIYQEINQYTEDELKSIETLCLELHYKYGLGICLCENEHKLFHAMYGYGNNTPEQFEEFKELRIKELNQKQAS